MRTPSPQDSRRIILQVLLRWERSGEYLRKILQQNQRFNRLPSRERALVNATVQGVIRRKLTLDYLINYYSRRLPSSKSVTRQILRFSIFQLLFLDRLPPHAVLHQAGELSRRELSRREGSYVNAVLRKVLARKQDLPLPGPETGVERLSVIYSHPPWLISRWLGRWREGEVLEICRINNLPPPVFIRANLLKITPEGLAEELRREKLAFRISPHHPAVFILSGRGPIDDLPAFQSGHFQVQDLSALAAVELLDVHPGQTVADLCAAPGGKTLYLAQKMKNRGALLAADASAARIEMLEENILRGGVKCASIRKLDLLRGGLPPGEDRFDRILLDVPCSNTGVLRRRVEARWRLQPDDIGRLSRQDLRLLQASAPLLKPGGKLVYSTCSLEEEENEAVVESFLNGAEDFSLKRVLQQSPREEEGDGYYAALLLRKGDG